MTFSEYAQSVKNIAASGNLEFATAILWLHPERLPLGLISAAGAGSPVIKVPGTVTNRFGNAVPVIILARKAFAGNTEVTDIVLPETLMRLPAGAFAGCRRLKNITLPKRVREIRADMFAGCDSLENIFYEGTPEEWENATVCSRRENDPASPEPGSPAGRDSILPGNEAFFSANIHFGCKIGETGNEYGPEGGGLDITRSLNPKL